jgi:acyl-CoA thioesterase YciA
MIKNCTERPEGMLSLRTIAMPKDLNAAGNIFGGWLVSQMDLAAGSIACQRARGPAVTVAIEKMEFHEPVFVGDEISCYTNIENIGRTSMAIKVEIWKRKRFSMHQICKVTEGLFIFVAIDESHKPRSVPEHED